MGRVASLHMLRSSSDLSFRKQLGSKIRFLLFCTSTIAQASETCENRAHGQLFIEHETFACVRPRHLQQHIFST
jgi:hypothetical protein